MQKVGQDKWKQKVLSYLEFSVMSSTRVQQESGKAINFVSGEKIVLMFSWLSELNLRFISTFSGQFEHSLVQQKLLKTLYES